jgi:molybdopterin-guanine dinucleotide biosynthesis protein MobB
MIPAVSFIGHHNSGKTRLLSRLIPYLVDRGFRVGAVKHSPHLNASGEPETDSEALGAAGAEPVLLLGESTAVFTWERTPEEGTQDLIDRLFPDCDFVLVEGMKRGPLPKIEVFRRGREVAREPLAGRIAVIAVITDDRIATPDGTVVLSPRDLPRIADLLESTLLQPRSIAPLSAL